MGSDQSNPNINQEVASKLESEIQEYNNGNIEKGTLRYQFLLMNARHLIDYDKFFSEVDIHKIADYISDLSVIKVKEGKRVVKQIVKASDCEETATNNLQIVLPKMRIKCNDSSKNQIFISPASSKELYSKVVMKNYKTKWGKYIPKNLFDWNSSDVQELYRAQSQDTLTTLKSLSHINLFFDDDDDDGKVEENAEDEEEENKNENKNEDDDDDDNDDKEDNDEEPVKVKSRAVKVSLPLPEGQPSRKVRRMSQITLPVMHTRDSSLLVLENPVDQLYKRNIKEMPESLPFEKKVSKPFRWKKSIHEASFLGDESSVKYCLYLLPILLNCPDTVGDTPAHKAALGGRPKIIKLLHSLGANFDLTNDEGFFPLHMSTDRTVVATMQSIGCDLNKRNAKGESLLEIKTRDFNAKIIETLLKFNINILEPSPKGMYWMQFAIYNEYFGKKMDFTKFQDFVRSILKKNAQGEYHQNPIFEEILQRKVKKCNEEDEKDINDSVTNKNVERIKPLLALGAHPDRVREDGKTNLMLCAERDDEEIAEILASNFCDTNKTNSAKENTFWVASIRKNFKTALVLRNHGADMNALSSSGKTILHVSYNDHIEDLFNFLLDAGASPNTKNVQNESVLFQAFRLKDDKTGELLQDKYKGDISTQAANGNTLAHFAVLEKEDDRLEYYISRKIDLEVKNDQGFTIFMLAIVQFDDLDLCQRLLDHGSDINTQDKNGNTALLNIVHAEEFSREKFDFLLKNNCNIDIQNIEREYPIAVCILNKLDEEAQILLDRGAKINDKLSYHEPIANSLKIGSQHWFEKLLDHGANALNEKYPVLVNYIRSDFFNFELMKSIKERNVYIGGPVQAAINKGLNDVASYFWDEADSETKLGIASSQDENGRVPISVAIINKYDQFVDQLIKKPFNVSKPDNENMTPFMFACISNQAIWMQTIFERIELKNANIVDNKGNSALTYAAENRNIPFCNHLFIENINVNGINTDKNGIIEAFRNLLDVLDQLQKQASYHFQIAEEAYNAHVDEVNHYVDKVNNLKSELDDARKDYAEKEPGKDFFESIAYDKKYNEYSRNLDKLSYARENLRKAKIVLDKYEGRAQELMNAKRSDLLYRIKELVRLAENDGDITVPAGNHHKKFSLSGAVGAVAAFALLGVLI